MAAGLKDKKQRDLYSFRYISGDIEGEHDVIVHIETKCLNLFGKEART